MLAAVAVDVLGDAVEVGLNIGRNVVEVEPADEDVPALQGHYADCRLQVVAYTHNHLRAVQAAEHRVEAPKKMFYARHFLTMGEILLAVAAYVDAAVRDERGYHLISVGMQKGDVSYAGMLVDSGNVVASYGLLESDGMEESPYHRHRHHRHPSCR
jgi:hypothetical protein